MMCIICLVQYVGHAPPKKWRKSELLLQHIAAMHLQHSDTFVCNILQHAKTPERVKLQIQLEHDTLQQLCNTLHQLELARFDDNVVLLQINPFNLTSKKRVARPLKDSSGLAVRDESATHFNHFLSLSRASRSALQHTDRHIDATIMRVVTRTTWCSVFVAMHWAQLQCSTLFCSVLF